MARLRHVPLRLLRVGTLFLRKPDEIRRAMGRIGRALLLIAGLRGTAHADGVPPDPISHDRTVTVRASEPDAGSVSISPWIDLAPTNVLEHHAAVQDQGPHRVAAVATL